VHMSEQVTIAPRRVLHDEIACAIRLMIAQRQLRPGARIPEQALCARFGVSRTPLREALKVLSAEGLVRLLPNRGAVVERLTPKEVDEMIMMLGVFEGLAAELACPRIDDNGVSQLRALHERMVEHWRSSEGEAYVEADLAFHAAIFRCADNSVLTAHHAMVHRRLFGLLAITQQPPPRWDEAVADHERMIEAVQAKDGQALGRIAREHARHCRDMAHAALDKVEQRGGERRRGFEAVRGIVDARTLDVGAKEHA
jgi:DNA-binding GntR family transcriptional regulator